MEGFALSQSGNSRATTWVLLILRGRTETFATECTTSICYRESTVKLSITSLVCWINIPFFLFCHSVSKGSTAGGEDHERPGLQQRQRGGFQRVCGAGGRPDRSLQRLLPREEKEQQVTPVQKTKTGNTL